jgi:hypothetical protein
MASVLNLLFSLPEVLQSEIYQYDNTYRIFGTEEFKDELLSYYIKSNNRLVHRVVDYLDTYIHDGGCIWYNEYGRIDPNNDLARFVNIPNYTSVNEFFVVIHHIHNAAYFKVLPNGSTVENCIFLRNSGNYDGYFIDHDRHDNLPNRILDASCMDHTEPIELYSYDGNHYKLIDERIGMYMA